MKKFILGLGTLASTVAPIAAVVACGTNADGSTVLDAEETQLVLSQVKNILGLDDSFVSEALSGEFSITVNSMNESGIDVSITRSHKGAAVTDATIQLSALTIDSDHPLEIATGETLHVQLTLNAGKDAIATTKMSLSGSKTTAKNAIVQFLASHIPNVADLKETFKNLASSLKDQKNAIKLTDANVATIEHDLGTQATSAEAIFDGKTATLSSIDVSKSTLLANLKMGKVDLKLTLVTQAGRILRVFGESEFADATEGKTTVIHLVGAVDMTKATITSLSTKEATVNGTKITLNDAGAKALTKSLIGISSPHSSGSGSGDSDSHGATLGSGGPGISGTPTGGSGGNPPSSGGVPQRIPPVPGSGGSGSNPSGGADSGVKDNSATSLVLKAPGTVTAGHEYQATLTF